MADSTRLGIPALTSVEGIHGLIQNGCTIFPQAIALGATFNPSLVEKMTEAEAREARAMGIAQLLSPVLDIARELRNLYAYPFAKVFRNAHPVAVMSCL